MDFEVVLEREVTEEGYVTVAAETREEALKKAEALPGNEIIWERTETGKHWATSAEKEEELQARAELIVDLTSEGSGG